MPSKQQAAKVRKLVADKFGNNFDISEQSASPNGLHFVLTDGAKTKTHVKVIETASVEEEGLDEIALLEAVDSKHVIKLIEHGELDDEFSYLTFPHISGTTIDKLETATGWNTTQLNDLAMDMAIAISDMHKAGIVHRDIKPMNIIKEDHSGKFILLDLGIGYFVDQADRDNTKAKGSRFYSSPEQFKSIESDTDDISFASDLFSLGVIMYKLATNLHPYENYSKEKFSTVGEAICKMPAPVISAVRTDLDGEIMAIIMRLLQKQPSRRYWSPQQFTLALKQEVADDVQDLLFYIAEPKSGDLLDNYLDGVNEQDKPDGVLLPIHASDDRIDHIIDRGLDVIIDPETYKLPFSKASQSKVRKKLKLPATGKLNSTKINDDKFLRKLVEKTVTLQTKTKAIILPFFAVTTLDDGLIEINRKVEELYFKNIHDSKETRDIYAGLMIPHSLIVNDKSRTKLLDRLMKGSKVNGYYVIFENSDESPFTMDDTDYLDGVSDILSMLKSQGKVIVGKADLSFMPLLKNGIIVTSPDKPLRRYSFANKLISPKEQTGGTGEEAWALRYYSEGLFNFIEDKTTLESLATLGFEDELGCSCTYCANSRPFDIATDKSHNDSRKHFYFAVAQLRNRLKGMKESEFRAEFISMLTSAADLAERIDLMTVGSERFSRHERLIKII